MIIIKVNENVNANEKGTVVDFVNDSMAYGKTYFTTVEQVLQNKNSSKESEDTKLSLLHVDDVKDDVMYIVTNQVRQNGFELVLDSKVAKRIGELVDDDYYVIPSSIREAIVLRCSTSPSVKDLQEMKAETDETQLKEDERSSYPILLYVREDSKYYVA